ncbi:hypothetical protein OAL35_02255, partial [bacterium]|nr:hypothetical protein [bacterium]
MAIRIENLRQETGNRYSDLIADVTYSGGVRTVAFRRYGAISELNQAEPFGEPFLVMLLMHAMKSGDDLILDGEIDPLLLYELQVTIQSVLCLQFSELKKVSIRAERRPNHPGRKEGAHVATGFSGGIDSMQLLDCALFKDELPEELRVSMLMHHNVGSVARNSQFDVNRSHAERCADELGLSFAGASCDVSPFYEGFTFLESHTMRTVAASMSLSPICKRYVYASGTELQVGLPNMCTRVIDAANPVLLPLLSTAQQSFKQFGAECTRLDKILQVMENETLVSKINVCARVSHDNSSLLNCGRCFKCFPVLLVAEALG